MGQRGYTQDAELIFRLAGALTASAAAVDADAAAIIKDVGDARFEAVMIIDVASIAIDGNDERYEIVVQGSNSATFASGIENLATLDLGAVETRAGGAQDSTIGRYELPFHNDQDGEVYRYLRIYEKHTGATSSISYTAWAGIKY